MARRNNDNRRLPLGDITNTHNQDPGSKKRRKDLEDGESRDII
jgi:hypothetical protein